MIRPSRIMVAGQIVEVIAPGLKVMRRAGGRRAAYWIASIEAVARGFLPKTVPLSVDWNSVDAVSELGPRCIELQTGMREWLQSGGKAEPEAAYNGTLDSLMEIYRTHRLSPYHKLESNTQATYRSWMKVLEQVGGRRLDRLKAIEMREWYDTWRKPAEKDGPERVRRAYASIQMLRILIGFGVSLEIRDCARLDEAMAKMTFEAPKPRASFMTYEQAEAFVGKAIELGEVRMALGHSCQFELTLRQGDVIGRWEPLGDRQAKPGEIVRRRHVWTGGLTFEMLTPDGLLNVVTSKTKRAAAFDLKLYPLVQRCLALVPDRTGPFVVRADGLPPDKFAYTKAWRRIATEAGIPKGIWNMDNRASGVTEARDAGAEMDDVAKHAQHASPATTRRVYDRSSVEVTSRVAQARVRRRVKSSSQSPSSNQ